MNPGPRHTPLPAAAAPLGRYAFMPSLPVLLAMAVALSAVVAALLMLAEPRAPFAPILVTSECIGLLILGWNMVFARLLTRWRLAPERAIGLSMIAATPLGYITGHGLARWLLGRPMDLFPTGRNHALDLLVTLLAGCLVAYLFWTALRLARERGARAEAHRLAVEAQLRLLRAQLEPHMMFNTLATLRSLVEVDPARAQHMIDRLITYLRAALAASRAETTTLAQEFDQLRAYLDIMALRMGARLEFKLDLPAALQVTPIPPMLLQPLVENAIRHGLEPQVGPGSLKVQALRRGAWVEISVADSGLGLPQAGDAESAEGGYGLHHVRERLAAIYGAQASLTLAPVAPHGVRATVRIPA